ncbi:MAG: alanine racemase [Devosia sp.]|nr:alanine racemase [Devosia sp.]
MSASDAGHAIAPSGVLTIDIAAIRANYAYLKDVSQRPVAAVVKADAYGLGAGIVSRALLLEGCENFCVAHLGEALSLRAALPETSRLFVLNGILPGGEAACAAANIVPVINSLDQLRRWADLAAALGRVLPAVMQVDTGMSRLGLMPEERQAAAMLAASGRIELMFVMSHLASADAAEDAQNGAQLGEMTRALADFPGAKLCFANSGGIFLGPAFHGAMVRSGIALYGGAPMGDRPNPMQPVVRLDIAVIQTRRVAAGALIGYGGTHVAQRPMRLATLAAGYADGLPRTLSDQGAAYFGGQRLPITGRVSMDSMVVDISALPEGTLKPGDYVEMIGRQQTLEALAQDAGTISYEILTGLGSRFARRYPGMDGVAVSEAK